MVILMLPSNLVYKTQSGKLAVILCLENEYGSCGKWRTAFLNPAKIKHVYTDGEKYYIEYDSNHPFYNKFDRGSLPRNVRPAELRSIIKECRRVRVISERPLRFAVYIPELERWDYHGLSLAETVSFLRTNIHPVYGLLD